MALEEDEAIVPEVVDRSEDFSGCIMSLNPRIMFFVVHTLL